MNREQNSEPFLVRWKDGKLVRVDAEPSEPVAKSCGHPTAAVRKCPLQGHRCSCCSRCHSECALDVEDDFDE